jgi:hypothetical protein
MRAVILLVVCLAPTTAWVIPTFPRATRRAASRLQMSMSTSTGNTHGQNSCFLPLQQLDQDYYAPRIVQVRYNIIISTGPLFLRVYSLNEELFTILVYFVCTFTL